MGVLAGRHLPKTYPSLEGLGPELNVVVVVDVVVVVVVAVGSAVAFPVAGLDTFCRQWQRRGGLLLLLSLLLLKWAPWEVLPTLVCRLWVSREWTEGSGMLG